MSADSRNAAGKIFRDILGYVGGNGASIAHRLYGAITVFFSILRPAVQGSSLLQGLTNAMGQMHKEVKRLQVLLREVHQKAVHMPVKTVLVQLRN